MIRHLVLILTVLFLQSCVVAPPKAIIEDLDFSSNQSAIALMPLDVELSLLTAAGLEEPRAEWTAAAKGFMKTEMTALFSQKEVKLIDASDIHDDGLHDLLSLHEVVGDTILFHHYFVPLPTKGTTLDWTLGDEAAALRQRFNADYGLFVYVRDSYSSGGRVALQVLAAVAGASVQGGVQVGFASLVDLRTGQIVWFNRIANTSGDLREEKPAAKTIDNLLDGFPLK